MATTPRRWPVEVEVERNQSLDEALIATSHLLEAQAKTDGAREKLHSNPNLSLVLLSEADRSASDALAGMERIQRCLIVCRGKNVNGRWPSVAAKQRDDALQAAQTATSILMSAQEDIARIMEKVSHHPSLSEVVIVDIARKQAKSLVLAERIARLMTEAALGRD